MVRNLQSVADLWQRASLVQRLVLLTVVLSGAGAAALLVNWARKPPMGPLYTALSPEDAAKIVDKIREAEVPYELRNGGTAVYVPEDQVYSLRLMTASEGLPAGGQTGYSLLDDDSIGTSPFTQRVRYRRAIEGELAKTIQMLDGVVAARVHVARPEPSLFAGRDKEPSATVALRLKAGRRLSPTDVAAIVHLVAGSVEGLLAGNVVVVDAGGNLLSGQTDNELAGGTNSFLDYKSRVEGYLARKAEDVLAAVLGPDRASVRVDATIDTSAINETTTTYLPDGRVVTREEEKTKSSTPPPAGAAGAAPGAAATKESTSSAEYLVSKKTEEKKDLPGKITSLSVAAVVDLSSQPQDQGGAAAGPKIAVKDVEEIIRSAIGLGQADSIKVVSAAFHRPEAAAGEETETGGFFNRDFLLSAAKRFSLGVLVIGALLALKMFGGSRKKAGALPALEGMTAEGRAALSAREVEGDRELLRARITRALQQDPDQVRQLFLTWAEGEEGEA